MIERALQLYLPILGIAGIFAAIVVMMAYSGESGCVSAGHDPADLTHDFCDNRIVEAVDAISTVVAGFTPTPTPTATAVTVDTYADFDVAHHAYHHDFLVAWSATWEAVSEDYYDDLTATATAEVEE